MIGWVLLSREAVARAEEALASNEKGVRDEVGFLALHQGFADRFFPGTSVLHTRLRYVLFVPWLMEKVTASATTDIARRLSDAETELAGQLKGGPDPDGVIGGRVWPRRTAQPPSIAYWTALGSWGILRQHSDGSLPSRSQTLRRLARRSARLKSRPTDDDGGILDEDATSPFVSLPPVPEELQVRGQPLDFALSPDERKFLRRQLLGVRRPDTTNRSLLARLADENGVGPAADDLWVTEIADIADSEDRSALVTARQAAALAGIGRGVYAALVERARTSDGLSKSTIHQDHLEEMLEIHGHDAGDIDLDALSDLLPNLPEDLSGVLSETLHWVKVGDDPSVLAEAYSKAEHNRKGLRARLPNTVAGRQRRAEWNPEGHMKAEPLHYRWPNVRRLLTDLQAK